MYNLNLMLSQDENGVTEEDESDEGGGGGAPTPPDSPAPPGMHGELERGRIIPDLDIYAIPSHPSECLSPYIRHHQSTLS
jgi:hypothetical protein